MRVLLYHQTPVEQKTSILPRRYRLSQLILSIRWKLSLPLVAFVYIRVELVPPSSSCPFFPGESHFNRCYGSKYPRPDIMLRIFPLEKPRIPVYIISHDLPFESRLEDRAPSRRTEGSLPICEISHCSLLCGTQLGQLCLARCKHNVGQSSVLNCILSRYHIQKFGDTQAYTIPSVYCVSSRCYIAN